MYRFVNNKRIDFGCGFFYIGQDAHRMPNSGLNFNTWSYQTAGYKYNKESYLKINSSQSDSFRVKEWEVIKVEFET